jgi:hypothetical protein
MRRFGDEEKRGVGHYEIELLEKRAVYLPVTTSPYLRVSASPHHRKEAIDTHEGP